MQVGRWDVYKILDSCGIYAWLTTEMMRKKTYFITKTHPFKSFFFFFPETNENPVVQNTEREVISVSTAWEDARKTVKCFPVYQA